MAYLIRLLTNSKISQDKGEVLEIRMFSVACMLIPVRERCKKSFLILCSDKEGYVCIL